METMLRNEDVQEIRNRVDSVLSTRGDEIFAGVRRCVVEVLNVDEDAVVPEAVLTDDLGAESLDVLDLVYRLETAFSTKLPMNALRRFAQGAADGSLGPDGALSDSARERLSLLMPEVDPARLDSGLTARSIPELYTVETFVRLVAWQQSAS